MNTRNIAAFLLVLVPAVAHAQPRGGGGGAMPVTPLGVSLDKVPVGSWAEYEVKRGGDASRKVRYALVKKDGGQFVLESRTETGRGERVVSQATVTADPSAEGGVKKLVTQFGDTDPMEMPLAGGRGGPGGPGAGAGGAGAGGGPGNGRGGMRMGPRFVKPDAKALVGKETLKLAGASYATEHYRQEGPRGGTLDFWLAKEAGPLGLVKLELDRPGGGDGDGPGGGKVTVELTGKGKGATAEITKPAKPFDPEAMRARWGNRGGQPPGPGAPN